MSFTRLGIVLSILLLGRVASAAENTAPLVGRWDLTMKGSDGSEFPSWLEVTVSGRTTLVGAFVGQFGSARPISKIEYDNGVAQFTIPPQWERRSDDQRFTFKLEGGQIKGETTDEKGHRVTFEGRRAPALKRKGEPAWGQTIELFNGNDLTGWHARNTGAKHGWVVRDGSIVNESPGNDLVTDNRFNDFKLHAEFRYPKGSNSGIYLRGRYELQIEDNYGDDPESHKIGGVYGFLTPSRNASKPAGEWQTVDVTLIGREVTVILNGERVIDRQSIPGITGGALESDEGAPGPIMIQGDHGKVEFRKLTLTERK